MEKIKIKIFAFFIIIAVFLAMLVFRFYIDKQKHLDIKELDQIVEKELTETHAKH